MAGRHVIDYPKRPGVINSACQKEPFFHLQIEADGCPVYWLHVELPAKNALLYLDLFSMNTTLAPPPG